MPEVVTPNDTTIVDVKLQFPMTLTLRVLETPDNFRGWLDRHEDDDIVGSQRSVCDCPLARFLLSCGLVNPNVTERYITAEERVVFRINKQYTTPEWATVFIRRIDTIDCAVPLLVSKREAIEVLDHE